MRRLYPTLRRHRNAGYILLDLDTLRRPLCQPCRPMDMSLAWYSRPARPPSGLVRVSPAPLEPAVATAIARHLARTYGGDGGSAEGRHLGRLAGFTNQKPGGVCPMGRLPG